MLGRVAAFEVRYLLKNPLLWFTAAAAFLVPFASLAFGLGLEEDVRVFRNAPWEVVSKYRIISCLFMFVTTVFVSNAVLRDDETGFGPILRSTGVRKADYLFGRFLGAFAVAALCLALVSPGIWIGALVAGPDATGIGPNRLVDHLYAYFLIGLPNVLITASIFFALATLSRSMMGTYVGLVVFLMAYFSLQEVLHGRPDVVQSLAVLEPFSARAFGDATRYWTTPERNTLLPPFAGALLYNRLLWIGISLAFLALAWRGFRFTEAGRAWRKRAKRVVVTDGADDTRPAAPAALPEPRFDARARRALLLARTRFEARQVLKSPAFVLMALWTVFTTWFVLDAYRDTYSRPAHPLAVTLIPKLEEIFVILPLVIVVIYAGELVWRERVRRMHEIVDATPQPNWAYVVPKTAAIGLVLAGLFLASTVAAVATQLSLGADRLDLSAYLLWFLLPMTVEGLTIAALAVFVQVLSPHKFVGWGIMVLYVAALFTGHTPDHNLLAYGGGPPVALSDMDGVSSFWLGPWVFRLYWSAAAALLLLASHLLWRRGTPARLGTRLRLAARRFTGKTRWVAAGALAVFAATGAYAFHNTNVLNRYAAEGEAEAHAAAFEQAYIRYADLPQPSIAHVELDIALEPAARRATVRGTYVLRNLEGAPIRDVHVLVLDRDLDLRRAELEGARLASEDAAHGYRVYRLARPMAPGETRRLRFETRRWHRGFPNGAPDTRIVDNGTFLANDALLPVIGMRGEPQVVGDEARSKHGLPPRPWPPRLEDAAARNVASGKRSWTTADITVSTTADQVPVAPGRRVSDTVRDGRRVARFVSDVPIRSAFAVQSARYDVRRREHRGIDLEVYHHPAHAWNVDHMLDMLEASLDYYQAAWGPYQFPQARIVEFPGYQANFAQAFANTIPSAESLVFTSDLSAPGALDYVAANVAHEMAHQYWGHQLVPADMQGAMLLVESLAQYSAVMVMRRVHGEDHVRRALRTQLAGYLSGRTWEQMEEVPLVRVGHQRYVMYNKGALALYLVQERLGEDAMNRALRSLLARHAFKGAPYATSLDLVAALRAEATTPGDQALITDLFERITLYDLKVGEVGVAARADGRWRVEVPVEARKFYANAAGAEQEAPLDERFDVGLFTESPHDEGFHRNAAIEVRRERLRSGSQVLTFVVDRKPKFAAIDPDTRFIDRNTADNVAGVD